MARPMVVKVGGSLFDLPDLGPRLRGWLECEAGPEVILLPGGGRLADVVRHLDRVHHLGEEKAHWLALRTLTVTAHFLADLLPGAVVTKDLRDCPRLWGQKRIPVMDAFALAEDDEHRPGHLPHAWDVTSDSLALRLAVLANACRVVLLKSVTLPPSPDWQEVARAGLVDNYFPALLAAVSERPLNPPLEVRAVDFRTWLPPPEGRPSGVRPPP